MIQSDREMFFPFESMLSKGGGCSDPSTRARQIIRIKRTLSIPVTPAPLSPVYDCPARARSRSRVLLSILVAAVTDPSRYYSNAQ